LGSARIVPSAYVLCARSFEVAIAVRYCSGFAEIREVVPDGPEDVFPGRRRVFEAFQAFRKFAIQEILEICQFGPLLPQQLCDRLIGDRISGLLVAVSADPPYQGLAYLPNERVRRVGGVLGFPSLRGFLVVVVVLATAVT
jgi:hypothetical protein